MEELTKQVKRDSLRTVLWIVIAMAIGIGVHYII